MRSSSCLPPSRPQDAVEEEKGDLSFLLPLRSVDDAGAGDGEEEAREGSSVHLAALSQAMASPVRPAASASMPRKRHAFALAVLARSAQ